MTSEIFSRSRFRVQSAPPGQARQPVRTFAGRKLPPIQTNQTQKPVEKSFKPSTPDPESVRRVLEQRMTQAMAGPETVLKKQASGDSLTHLTTRRGSLRREMAMTSQDATLVELDAVEISMLHSINRANYAGKEGSFYHMDGLLKHEFEDVSDEESEKVQRRPKISLVRQFEQDDINAPLDGVRLSNLEQRQSALKSLEDRLAGYRHEKMRSSTRSGDLPEDLISGLVYDVDFDCYYNPRTDTYYRLKSMSKSEEAKF
ncbi:unnamed protein product [Caenorhabditis auriculariae]|uniref:Uncharacterized protein n=1 Tax=Caenorhabditis auriculariae TaxID=2777116 RepID=A0A8S1H685_9PELO|nr:unnamed protein product [Caenorhabditis auriculariae]